MVREMASRKRSIAFVIVLLLAVGVVWSLEPTGADEPSRPFAPAETAEGELPVIQVRSILDLRSRVGKTLTVEGDVARVGSSQSGHRFINFHGNSEFSVFISSEDVAKFVPDPPEKAFAGKTVAVTGTVERFNNKLQMRVHSPEAIRIVERVRGPPSDEAKRPEPVELKPFGRDGWISPAGLRYVGRDPDGRTRKEHILRHARDFPDRPGPHGVFDGGEELAFAWIDAAWEKIQKQKIPADQDDGRETYTVSMGQRVGYLGGESGRRSGHPPLTRIFIVLRKGTTEVITAFPK